MKKYTLGLMLTFALFFIHNANAILPLKEGDVIATHSPFNASGGQQIVVRQIITNDTSTAPMNGHTWTSPPTSPYSYNPKPPNWNAANWTANAQVTTPSGPKPFGAVFGITLDSQTPPNIYVSNSQIGTG